MIGLAFLKDYKLEVEPYEGSAPYAAIGHSSKLDFNKINPLRGIISQYLDYNVGDLYKGTTIDDWLEMDIVKRDMLIEEIEFFEERKQAAIAEAKKKEK